MASPLAWFRRHQKGMLIVFGVLLMAVFGLPAAFQNMIPNMGRNPEMSETVVKYNGGKYTRGEFREYRYRNAQAVRYVRELQQWAYDQDPDNYRARAQLIGVLDSDSPESADRLVMQQIMLLKKADEIGMKVGDDAVIDYLRDIANDDQMPPSEFEKLCFQVFKGNPDFITVREQLKKELASQQMLNILTKGVPAAPSITEAWEDWQKLNKRRAANLISYPVKDFLEKVSGEPKLSDLRSLFAEGEFKYPDLGKKEPGFKQRRRVKVVTFQANYEDFLTNAENSITSEQVQDLYDQMVKEKDQMVMEMVPLEEESKDEDGSPEFNMDAEEDGGEQGDDDQGDSESPAEKTDAGKTDEDSDVDADKKDDEKSDPEDDGDKDENNEEGDDGLPQSGPSASSMQEEGSQEEQEDGKKESSEPESKQEEKKVQGPELETGSDADANADAVAMPNIPASGSPEQDILDGIGNQPERRVKPLDEELAKLLKRQIARQPATTAMTRSIQECSGDIGDYGSDMNAYESTKDGPVEDREEMPADLDLDALARKYKLKKMETELLDQVDFRESEVGKTSISVTQYFQGRPFAMPRAISEFVFDKYYDLTEWAPETLPAHNSENQFILAVVEKSNPKVLSFDEAKESVVKFWRHQQAVELAQAAAQKVADEVNSSSAKLEEKFPADAKSVGEFSYHTSRSLYPELAAVAIGADGGSTDAPTMIQTSPEFMETAFALEMNKAGVTIDYDRDNVFVVQLTGVDTRTEEELHELFFTEVNVNQGITPRSGIGGLFTVDREEFMRKYFEEVEKEYDIKWLAH